MEVNLSGKLKLKRVGTTISMFDKVYFKAKLVRKDKMATICQ